MEVAQKKAKTEPLNLKETELCLGLPGGGAFEDDTTKSTGKRGFSKTVDLKLNLQSKEAVTVDKKPPSKARVIGWPPVRSYRKNAMTQHGSSYEESDKTGSSAAFVKVSIDGAPYLRKLDLKIYKSYQQLSDALGNMFNSFTKDEDTYGTEGMIDFMNESKLIDLLNSTEYVPSYEDKDGDWMLVGDVPWNMFVDSCKRLRIMKGSEAIGLAPKAVEKCKGRS